nr:tether containing UBX domain for GLUT4-like [Macaca nemestrina]
MAAPAGGGGSAVSVLAPNGRRHTVKVTPSTVLLQVLEDTCRRQDFNPCEYDLKRPHVIRGPPCASAVHDVLLLGSCHRTWMAGRGWRDVDGGTWMAGRGWECLQHPSGATPVCVYTRDEVRASMWDVASQARALPTPSRAPGMP